MDPVTLRDKVAAMSDEDLASYVTKALERDQHVKARIGLEEMILRGNISAEDAEAHLAAGK